jgi:spore cortex formation protein SpoVR/YcgB (stage V sporulation)
MTKTADFVLSLDSSIGMQLMVVDWHFGMSFRMGKGKDICIMQVLWSTQVAAHCQ